MSWMPIETAPKDGTYVVLWEQWGDAPFVGYWVDHPHPLIGGWTAYKGHLNTDGDANVVNYFKQEHITHWQPLPEPPAS